MTKIIKILIIKLLFFLFVLNNNVFSKALPPGSGAGDVPANILILLDSSDSMSSNPLGGDTIMEVGDIVLLNDGSILVGQKSNAGILKMNYASEDINTDFSSCFKFASLKTILEVFLDLKILTKFSVCLTDNFFSMTFFATKKAFSNPTKTFA